METNWKQELMEKYPKIFKNRNENPMGGGSLMGFGLEVGDGWRIPLEVLCQRLDTIYQNTGVICVADQVKEKFASLRFYYHIEIDSELKSDSVNDLEVEGRISGTVHTIEEICGRICEVCGAPGKLNKDNYWQVTICDSCNAEREKTKEEGNLKWSRRTKNQIKT